MTKSLKSLISIQLEELESAVEKVRNTVINSTEEETWDLDHYSDLETKLEKSLELLKDQVIKGKHDEFGDPIIINKGILTLLDEWTEENKEDNE